MENNAFHAISRYATYSTGKPFTMYIITLQHSPKVLKLSPPLPYFASIIYDFIRGASTFGNNLIMFCVCVYFPILINEIEKAIHFLIAHAWL